MTTQDTQKQPDSGLLELQEKNHGITLQGLILSVTIISLLTFALIKLSDPTTLPIQHVSINGNFIHLSPLSLQERASSVVRGGFFSVNVEKIQEVLRDEPWVKDVMVRRIWPDSITVNIEEHSAVARWGDDGLIDTEAFIFYPDKSTFPKGLPYLSGPEQSAGLIMDYLYRFEEIIPDDLEIYAINLSDRRSWKLVMSNGLELQIGKSNVLDRTAQFFDFYSSVSLSHESKIKYADLRYTNGFVIGWGAGSNSETTNGQEKYGKES